MHDVIIIGAGPAGLSAAFWCDELGLDTLVLEQAEEIGGQLHRVYNPINNYLGLKTRNGTGTAGDLFRGRFGSRLRSVDRNGDRVNRSARETHFVAKWRTTASNFDNSRDWRQAAHAERSGRERIKGKRDDRIRRSRSRSVCRSGCLRGWRRRRGRGERAASRGGLRDRDAGPSQPETARAA